MTIPSIPWLTKRQKYVLIALTLASSMAILSLWAASGWGIILVLVSHYLALGWALDWDLKQEEWVVLPLYFLLMAGEAYALFSLYATGTSWLLWTGAGLYSLVVYGLLLTLNVVNLSRVKALPLARPAISVLSMVGFGNAFILFYLTLINQPTLIYWILAVIAISWLVAWPLIWLGASTKNQVRRSLAWSALVAVIASQVGLLINFWPISFLTSLALAVVVYVATGVIHHTLRHQLTKTHQAQYLLICLIVLVMIYATSSW